MVPMRANRKPRGHGDGQLMMGWSPRDRASQPRSRIGTRRPQHGPAAQDAAEGPARRSAPSRQPGQVIGMPEKSTNVAIRAGRAARSAQRDLVAGARGSRPRAAHRPRRWQRGPIDLVGDAQACKPDQSLGWVYVWLATHGRAWQVSQNAAALSSSSRSRQPRQGRRIRVGEQVGQSGQNTDADHMPDLVRRRWAAHECGSNSTGSRSTETETIGRPTRRISYQTAGPCNCVLNACSSTPLRYRCHAEPSSHEFHVTLQVPPLRERPGAGSGLSRVDAGSYMVRDFSRHIYDLQTTSNGARFPVTAGQIALAGRERRRPVQVSYRVFAL